ncbi:MULTISPECIES: CHAT domain-containing protein [unclassified Bradyrhizobium]|uniref:CHAT domain-containing protein n=1 Tax=unclassified Bradyrhizobium TaxID=2631580 RepID=UPI0028EC189B|nr:MULTISPECIES: CHAT domain-containing protein [unclassified Bradyrhizobium]
MEQQVLIVHPSGDMIVEIGNLLEKLHKTKGYDLHWQGAKTRKAAEAQASSERVDLIITALEIAADEKSPLGAGEQCRLGIALVKTLRSKASKVVRAIIISHHIDDELAEFTRLPATDWAKEGGGFAGSLMSAAERLLGAPQPDNPPCVLSISLSRDKDRCKYQFQEVGAMPHTACPLSIDVKALERLIEKTSRLHVKEACWEAEFKEIGEDLERALFEKPENFLFRDALNQWIGNRKGIANIKVRFTVDDTLHPLAVEAVKGPGSVPAWNLETTIYRGLEPLGGGPGLARPSLFTDGATIKGPLNFLIIAANVQPNTKVEFGGQNVKFDPLENLESEVNEIATLLWNLKKTNGCPIGKLRIVGSPEGSRLNKLKDLVEVDLPDSGSLKGLVQDTLQKAGKWHIVHYVGHTYYDSDNQVGYMILPNGTQANQAQPIKIAEFALWLSQADTRLVFLSSCSSAGQDFIYHLAKERVPAIMGFLWEVLDAPAREYAKRFYQSLLDGRHNSLEYACLAAKRQMEARDHDNPIWASPVLVMQVS